MQKSDLAGRILDSCVRGLTEMVWWDWRKGGVNGFWSELNSEPGK
jgi:hypothetical protein